MFEVNTKDATEAIKKALLSNLVPYLVGSPGVGKSEDTARGDKGFGSTNK